MNERIFNSEQQAVIQLRSGFHLVLAPPGCGKTAVLAERIAWARQQGVEFKDMACLTFTNRAARGMRERIMDRVPQTAGLDDLFVGNVHRFCSRFIFEHALVPGHTSVIDTDTSISIIADILEDDELRVLGDNKQRQHYSQIINLQHLLYQCCQHHPKQLIVHRDALPASALRELCVGFNLPYTQDTVIDLYMHADHYRDEHPLLSPNAQQLLRQIYAAREYEKYKSQNDLLDFEDLLLVTYDAMSHQTERPQYRWLQIDEVQDLNPLQLAIIDLFSAPDATVVCLGDAQQAIFSFMGAKTNTLAALRQRALQSGGPSHLHNFFQNYRSPQYLLNVFNTYAEQQLGISRDLLPSTTNQMPMQPGDLTLMACENNIDEANIVAREVKRICREYPQDTVAVVVAFNSDADDVSAALSGVPHFKISGTDFFSTPPVRLLLAHLCVVSSEHSFIEWAHIMAGLRVASTNSGARQLVQTMRQLAMTPADLIDYDASTYVAEFTKVYERQDLVVFDTETTGLDVFSDDVVQIAAVKVRQGRVVDELNLFVETSRTIPERLGDVVNPLVEEYARHEHLSPREALGRFVTFAKGCVILGHNATYDYQIMEHNMRRYAPEYSMHTLWPVYFDSLKLTRLLCPRQRSYKLKDLLVQLGLEGENSHLANDDILATLSLAEYCYDRARSIIGRQMEYLDSHRKLVQRFRALYAPLYNHSRERLYVEAPGALLVDELRYTYDYLLQVERMTEQPKLSYLLNYIETDLLTAASGHSLSQQLSAHLQDLCTMKEADLCGSASMTERVFVSTVHKAKGLEFDHVIVYDAVDGKYPSAYSSGSTPAKVDGDSDLFGPTDDEEARKFYVAISRARKHLIITYCRQSVNRWGRTFSKELTPYMASVRKLFQE